MGRYALVAQSASTMYLTLLLKTEMQRLNRSDKGSHCQYCEYPAQYGKANHQSHPNRGAL